LIFEGFQTWVNLVLTIVPRVTLWVDGGFVTYKDVPPKDVDVAMIVSPSDLNRLDADQQGVLAMLLTEVETDTTPRRQPMGGLVDGFLARRGVAEEILFWNQTWSDVYVDGKHVVGESKGYLEVKL
jgi:hypothetical protein